jgi:hypothetical protein
MNTEIFRKTYIIENKMLSLSSAARVTKKKGVKKWG